MASINPATGQPLPADAIQRVLFLAPQVHVYNIPPLTSTKGYNASTWTANNNERQIFTARLRVLETATTDSSGSETVRTDILLEDPKTGELFAAAPYTTPAAVEQVLDSSRFFAVRVVGEGGRKATLGIGFEERSEAFDFGISLQEVRKVQGLDKAAVGSSGRKTRTDASEKLPEKKDFSLKEGETITVNIGGRGRRQREERKSPPSYGSEENALFSIAPPPSGAGVAPLLPPPPSAASVKQERRRSRQTFTPESFAPPETKSTTDLGFDDGEFGEFQ
ncbi:MAG: hypothetical protein M1819_001229 [Sarea resinae]|nr:MAG: hypothetical protein M1819_001229 [Sarea resinae]